jgi:uncharacterized protein (DUF433 family)
MEAIEMSLNFTPQSVPLLFDEHGTVRVGGTRVTLDSVIAVFKQGGTAEEIVQSFPTLKLPDVYAVLTFYLRNQDQVESYLEQQEREAEAVRAELEKYFDNGGLRERLLARKRAKDAGHAKPAG